MTYEQLNKKYNVSRETFEKLELYVQALLKWNKAINLIGRSTTEEVWQRHIQDSLNLMQFLDKEKFSADLGTGAGIPGLILSIAGMNKMALIESDTKKVNFLKFAAAELSLSVEIIHARIEDINDRSFEQIVSRALAPLDKLFSLCSNIYTSETIFLFMKGKDVKREVEIAQKTWHFRSSITATNDGNILEIRDLRPHVQDKNNRNSEPKGGSW